MKDNKGGVRGALLLKHEKKHKLTTTATDEALIVVEASQGLARRRRISYPHSTLGADSYSGRCSGIRRGPS